MPIEHIVREGLQKLQHSVEAIKIGEDCPHRLSTVYKLANIAHTLLFGLENGEIFFSVKPQPDEKVKARVVTVNNLHVRTPQGDITKPQAVVLEVAEDLEVQDLIDARTILADLYAKAYIFQSGLRISPALLEHQDVFAVLPDGQIKRVQLPGFRHFNRRRE